MFTLVYTTARRQVVRLDNLYRMIAVYHDGYFKSLSSSMFIRRTCNVPRVRGSEKPVFSRLFPAAKDCILNPSSDEWPLEDSFSTHDLRGVFQFRLKLIPSSDNFAQVGEIEIKREREREAPIASLPSHLSLFKLLPTSPRQEATLQSYSTFPSSFLILLPTYS